VPGTCPAGWVRRRPCVCHARRRSNSSFRYMQITHPPTLLFLPAVLAANLRHRRPSNPRLSFLSRACTARGAPPVTRWPNSPPGQAGDLATVCTSRRTSARPGRLPFASHRSRPSPSPHREPPPDSSLSAATRMSHAHETLKHPRSRKRCSGTPSKGEGRMALW
jgi:hypothetical protein